MATFNDDFFERRARLREMTGRSIPGITIEKFPEKRPYQFSRRELLNEPVVYVNGGRVDLGEAGQAARGVNSSAIGKAESQRRRNVERMKYRDAMISLADPNDAKGKALIAGANSWFRSDRDITDGMRKHLEEIIRGRYAKVNQFISNVGKPKDFLDFKQEQEDRIRNGVPFDSSSTEQTPSKNHTNASRRDGAPVQPQGRTPVVRPFTGNYATGIDRSEGRVREQNERERIEYWQSGRGQYDYWQAKLVDLHQRKEASDARRNFEDLKKLLKLSGELGIRL